MLFQFPDHMVDPKQKGREWIMQYCKAAWHQNAGTTHGSYITTSYDSQRLLDYAQGKQSVSNYRNMLGLTDGKDEEWLKISWEPLAILPRFLEMALARLRKYEYNVIATPVDANSQMEINKWFKKQEAKIVFRQELNKLDPELAQISPAAKQEGEPEDMDDLKIMKQYSYKHQFAAEVEEALEAILVDNHFDDERAQAREDALYFGMTAYKEEVGEDGRIYVRRCDPSKMIISPSARKDFYDAEYCGEVRFITIADLRRLAPELSDAEIEKIGEKYLNKFGNPAQVPRTKLFSRAYDDLKVRVLDLEFDSTNRMAYEKSIDKRGNKRVSRADLERVGKKKTNGRYMETHIGVVYRACWVIDTDVLFNFGLLRDMKRRNADPRRTQKSYHVRVYQMSGGNWSGKLEQCTQIVDIIAMAWFRLQQAIAEARPDNGFAFDLDALDDIPLGKGGKQMGPGEVMDLFLKKNIFPYRSMDTDGNKTHYVPITALSGGLGKAAQEYFQVIQNNIMLLQQILGISEVSAGGAPERMNKLVAEISDQSTEDALASVALAEKLAFESMLNGVVQRLKSVARKNKGETYEFMIGTESMKFFELSPDWSMREMAIRLEDKPDAQQKMELINMATQFAATGEIKFDDLVLIRNTQNLKKAEAILANRIQKRRDEMQQEALQQQQMNGQIQQQSAMVAAQAEQQTLQLEYDLKLRNLMEEKKMEMIIEEMRLKARMAGDQIKAQAAIESTITKADSDEYRTQILAAANQEREASKRKDDIVRK